MRVGLLLRRTHSRAVGLPEKRRGSGLFSAMPACLTSPQAVRSQANTIVLSGVAKLSPSGGTLIQS